MIIYKPRWGAFYKTPLEDYLHKLGVSSLVFTGATFPTAHEPQYMKQVKGMFGLSLLRMQYQAYMNKAKKKCEIAGYY